MTAGFAGYNAEINGACNKGTRWTADITCDLLDATSFCSNGWKEFVTGLRGGTFTIESLSKISITDGTELVLKNDAVTITGKANVSSISAEVSVDGLCTFVYSGSFTDEVTIT